MLWLKGCPRCGGNLNDNRDFYGSYVMCLQCRYYHDVVVATAMALDQQEWAAASQEAGTEGVGCLPHRPSQNQ